MNTAYKEKFALLAEKTAGAVKRCWIGNKGL